MRGARFVMAPYVMVPFVVAAAVLVGATGSDVPVIEAVNWTPNPNERVPLAALCHVVTDRPTRAEIDLMSRDHDETIVFEGLAGEHDLAILGVHPDTDYEVVLRVTDNSSAFT